MQKSFLQRTQENLEERRKNQQRQETLFKPEEPALKFYSSVTVTDEVYQRQIEKVKRKQEWIEDEKKKKQAMMIEESKNSTFHPKILPQSKQLNQGRTRTPEKYFQDAMRFEEEKRNHLANVKQQLQEQEKQKHPFSPNLNHKSLKHVLEEYQANKQFRLHQIYKQTMPSFSPQINNRSRSKKSCNRAMPIQASTPLRQKEELFINDQVVKDFRSFVFFQEKRNKLLSNDCLDKIIYEENIKKQLILLNDQLRQSNSFTNSHSNSPRKKAAPPPHARPSPGPYKSIEKKLLESPGQRKPRPQKPSPYKSIISRLKDNATNFEPETEKKVLQKNYFPQTVNFELTKQKDY